MNDRERKILEEEGLLYPLSDSVVRCKDCVFAEWLSRKETGIAHAEKGKTMSEYIVRETDCGLATRHEIVGELVRCKDCRFYRFYDGTFGKGWMCFENNTARHGDDFCSRGEREGDADE